MYIFELTIPGTWIDHEDREWSWKISGLIQNLQSQFYDANTALNLFEQSRQAHSDGFDRNGMEQDFRRRTEIRREVESTYGSDISSELWGRISLEADIKFKREKWSKGHIPRELQSNVAFIYARAYLYALDGFDKFLAVLSKEVGVPSVLLSAPSKVEGIFPDLRGVRNTAQHLEDRSRGLGAGRNPKPMQIQPVNNNIISAPGGGVLLLNILNGKRYGATMSDGHYGEIEVSADSLQRLQVLLQQILDSFNWRGPAQHTPSD